MIRICLVNLAGDEAYADVLAELRDKLEQDLRAQSDPRILGYGDIYESFPEAYAHSSPI